MQIVADVGQKRTTVVAILCGSDYARRIIFKSPWKASSRRCNRIVTPRVASQSGYVNDMKYSSFEFRHAVIEGNYSRVGIGTDPRLKKASIPYHLFSGRPGQKADLN